MKKVESIKHLIGLLFIFFCAYVALYQLFVPRGSILKILVSIVLIICPGYIFIRDYSKAKKEIVFGAFLFSISIIDFAYGLLSADKTSEVVFWIIVLLVQFSFGLYFILKNRKNLKTFINELNPNNNSSENESIEYAKDNKGEPNFNNLSPVFETKKSESFSPKNNSLQSKSHISEKTMAAIERGEFYNDSLLRCAIQFSRDTTMIDANYLQHRLKITTLQAIQLLRDLEYLHLVSLPNDHGKQVYLLEVSQIPELLNVLAHSKVKDEFSNRYESYEFSIQNDLSGYQFEEYCCGLLEKNGFKNVQQTQQSRDYGVDIVAEKDKISYAIQCKYYSSPVGVGAVQEIVTGAKVYDCDISVVMTNSSFTNQAIQLAKQTRTKLWDAEVLKEMESRID